MKRQQAIFDISEIRLAFQQGIAHGSIDVPCAALEGLFEIWLQRHITNIHHVGFSIDATTNNDESFPDWLLHKVDRFTKHAQSLMFHWLRFPTDIEVIVQLFVDDIDLLLEYIPKENRA